MPRNRFSRRLAVLRRYIDRSGMSDIKTMWCGWMLPDIPRSRYPKWLSGVISRRNAMRARRRACERRRLLAHRSPFTLCHVSRLDPYRYCVGFLAPSTRSATDHLDPRQSGRFFFLDLLPGLRSVLWRVSLPPISHTQFVHAKALGPWHPRFWWGGGPQGRVGSLMLRLSLRGSYAETHGSVSAASLRFDLLDEALE